MAKKLPPVSPGEILNEEYLVPLDMSANKLAGLLKVPANRVSAIISGKREITPDTALRLARVFDTTPEFWMGLQMLYSLELEQRKPSAAKIERVVKPLELHAA